MEKKIRIPEEIVTKLQNLAVEVESRSAVIQRMIQEGVDTTTTAFITYQNEYKKYYAEYESEKMSMQKAYIDPAVNYNGIRWSLDFNTGEATILYKE